MMSIKEKLTCKHCKTIYKDIEELIANNSSNKLFCPFCNQENLNQQFSINKLIKSLLEIELHKFKINPKYEKTLNNLKIEIEKMALLLKDPEHFIFEEFSELKRQVDLDRENLKMEIDELADCLIQQLESYEKRFKTEYKSNINIEHYNGLVESSRKQLTEYEKCLSLFSVENEKREEEFKESEQLIQRLQPKFNEIKNKLFSNLLITYKPMENNVKASFGKLIIKVSLFELNIRVNFINELFQNLRKIKKILKKNI